MKHIQRGLLGFLVGLLVFSIGCAQDDSVVIRLGNQSETVDAFNDRFEIALRGMAITQGTELTEEVRAQLNGLKPQFLERRAMELVLLQEAEKREITVSDEEISEQVEAIRSGVEEGDTFESLLEKAGFSDEAQLTEFVRENSLVQKVVEQIQAEVDVSDEAVAAAYEARKSEFQQAEQACARHILLATEEEAQAVLDELSAGADFAELAIERSTGPSGPDGGDLSCFDQQTMVQPFAEAAFAAELNQPVGPVETQFGFHVILVYERKEAGVAPLEDVSLQLSDELVQEQFADQLDQLREASGVEVFPEILASAEEEPIATDTEPAPPAEDAAGETSEGESAPENETTGEETEGGEAEGSEGE